MRLNNPFRQPRLGLALLLAALTASVAVVGCGTSAGPEREEAPIDAPAPATARADVGAPAEITTPAPVAKRTISAPAESAPEPTTASPATAPTATETGATEDSPATAPPASATPTRRPTAALADWERELRTANIRRGGWKTDFSKRNVPYGEIFSGGVPRDGIPPIDDPKFVSVVEADRWLEGKEPVIAFEQKGAARGYPLQILTWHEIVNDEVGGVPVVATFCPLCNSALVFDRRLDGVVYDFGVSGNLRNSDLIMWDRQTESWWQQLTGEAIVGELTGRRLDILPASIVAWDDFKAAYPEAQILSQDTGHSRNYGVNPYVGYDEVGQSPFLFFAKEDDRLLPMERVAALTVGEEAAAYPFSFLESRGVVHDTVGGQELAVFFKAGARSALDGYLIADSKEVGSTGVFRRDLEGQTLTFASDSDPDSDGDGEGDGFIDRETGSRWNIFGLAVDGPYAGKRLTPVVHANHFWFAWAAFRPDTKVVQSE